MVKMGLGLWLCLLLIADCYCIPKALIENDTIYIDGYAKDAIEPWTPVINPETYAETPKIADNFVQADIRKLRTPKFKREVKKSHSETNYKDLDFNTRTVKNNQTDDNLDVKIHTKDIKKYRHRRSPQSNIHLTNNPMLTSTGMMPIYSPQNLNGNQFAAQVSPTANSFLNSNFPNAKPPPNMLYLTSPYPTFSFSSTTMNNTLKSTAPQIPPYYGNSFIPYNPSLIPQINMPNAPFFFANAKLPNTNISTLLPSNTAFNPSLLPYTNMSNAPFFYASAFQNLKPNANISIPFSPNPAFNPFLLPQTNMSNAPFLFANTFQNMTSNTNTSTLPFPPNPAYNPFILSQTSMSNGKFLSATAFQNMKPNANISIPFSPNPAFNPFLLNQSNTSNAQLFFANVLRNMTPNANISMLPNPFLPNPMYKAIGQIPSDKSFLFPNSYVPIAPPNFNLYPPGLLPNGSVNVSKSMISPPSNPSPYYIPTIPGHQYSPPNFSFSQPQAKTPKINASPVLSCSIPILGICLVIVVSLSSVFDNLSSI